MKSSILTRAFATSLAGIFAVGCAHHRDYDDQASTYPGPTMSAGTPREVEQGLAPTEPPPAPQSESEFGTPPSSQYVWVPGNWEWHRGHWVWVRGRWEVAPRPQAVWVPGHWDRRGHHYVWVPGYWR